MAAIDYVKQENGIVRLSIAMDGPVNVMNAVFRAALAEVVARLESEADLQGVIIVSARKVFLAGADLNEFAAVEADDAADLVALLDSVKALMARLEALPVPVVAAINGAALGGGFELCLACDYRIAVDNAKIRLGLPEVHLGLLPAGGGVVRLVRNLGLQAAMPHLLRGSRLAPAEALAAGFIDATADDEQALEVLALTMIQRKPEKLRQPSPQGQTFTLAQFLDAATLNDDSLHLPAQREILQCAHIAVSESEEKAYAEESLAVGRLITMPQTKTLIEQFFASR